MVSVLKPRKAARIILIGFFFFSACSTFTPRSLPDCQTVIGVPGPEDFALDPTTGRGRHPRLLVSSQNRRLMDPNGEMLRPGAIFAMNLEGPGAMTPETMPFEGRDDYPFHPHGIDLVQAPTGLLLYVINHALTDTHCVEVFRVEGDKLVFLKRLHSSLLIHPNDLTALPDGQLYISNDRAGQGLAANLCDFFVLGCGSVTHYSPAENLWRVVAEDISFANGVAVKDDRLYVAGTRDEGIHVYRRDPFTGAIFEKTAFWDLDSGVDNLMWENETTLNVAAHPDIFAFLDHANDENEHAPGDVYRVDITTGQATQIFADDGRQMDAPATALVYNNRLYISGVFDPEILHCAID
ncbi:MAG: hypothetical protein RIF32_15125 [Leptospirales bacterium]|jgi:arylesterase/paraoxonase